MPRTHTRPHPAEHPLRPAAVLVCLFVRDGATQVLFTRRAETVRNHKGQISFPGGARDPGDSSLRETALREAFEELGLPPASVELLGELDSRESVSDFLVTPFVGWLAAPPPRYQPRPEEVAEVLEVPVSVLREPARQSSYEVEWQGAPRQVHAIDTGAAVVWGLTARITLELLSLLDFE